MSSARPKTLLFYYGYLNSFNSAINGWNNESVAMDMAKYDVCVFGDGMQNPTHPDYANAQIILARLKALKPELKIYGYVTANQTQGDIETKTNQWDTLHVDGIFIDEAGYDYGVTRDELNLIIVHVRSQTYANKCFVNAWNMDHVIGIVDDSSYPNATYNPSLHASLLDSRDIYLLESFSVNTDFYAGNNGYATKSDVLLRGNKAVSYSNSFGIQIATLGIIDDASASGKMLSNFAYHSSILFGFDYEGTSSAFYGAGTAAVRYWDRPGIKHIGRTPSINVIQSLNDADVVERYGVNSKVLLDFSTGAQISTIQNW